MRVVACNNADIFRAYHRIDETDLNWNFCSQMMSDSTYLLSLVSQPYFSVSGGKQERVGKNSINCITSGQTL